MDTAHDAALALRKSLSELMPRVGYAGDGTSIPRMAHLHPVVHKDTGTPGFLLMDALERENASYIVPLLADEDTANALANEGTGISGFMTSAVARYHAEWN